MWVKNLSASGALASYHIVHLATYAALPGQLTGTVEPDLILTPPERATEADDGYLSASEIAGLKLDADWVILYAIRRPVVPLRAPKPSRASPSLA
jgi:hypothetical protein